MQEKRRRVDYLQPADLNFASRAVGSEGMKKRARAKFEVMSFNVGKNLRALKEPRW